MDNNKRPQLNGAYYGPSIPPPERQPHHHHRGRRCCCCLFGIIWKLLVAIIVLVGLIFLVFVLVVQPRAFKFSVTEAKLTEFNYTAGIDNRNSLRYNLVLNFTARNPNKKLNIYYDKVEGHAFYEGTRFASTDVITSLNSFRQYTKTTDRMSGVFSGHHVMVLDHDQVSDFERDKRDGVFDIDVKLYFTIRFRLGDLIGGDTKAKAKCELQVPLAGSSGTTVTAFQPTKCDVNF